MELRSIALFRMLRWARAASARKNQKKNKKKLKGKSGG